LSKPIHPVKNGKKICSKCKRILLVKFFNLRLIQKRGYRFSSRCKECLKEDAKLNRINNPERVKISLRKHRLKVKYGLSLESFNELFRKQEGKCAICGISEIVIAKSIYEKLHVDHNHNNGKVRGLLCPSCNVGIGHFRHNPKILNKAIEYLRKAG
jgi:hypothetical protein